MADGDEVDIEVRIEDILCDFEEEIVLLCV